MVVVEFDEVFELAIGTVQVQCHIEVLLGRLLFTTLDGWGCITKLVLQNAQNLSVFAVRAQKKEIIGPSCPASELSFSYCFGAVVRLTPVKRRLCCLLLSPGTSVLSRAIFAAPCQCNFVHTLIVILQRLHLETKSNRGWKMSRGTLRSKGWARLHVSRVEQPQESSSQKSKETTH